LRDTWTIGCGDGALGELDSHCGAVSVAPSRRLTGGRLPHALNFTAGWWLILAAFASGALVGLGFHREDFLGGYASFRRRLVRLGHIALAALGALNIIYGLSPVPVGRSALAVLPGGLLLAGAIAMPAVCFLSAWREPLRRLFPLPVTLLVVAVILILVQGS
jgi:hypothetical protein